MIVRAPRPQSDFTTYHNAMLRDVRLSLKARGLLTLLLSYPDDWRSDYRTLARQFPEDGETSFRSAIKALRDTGYMVQSRRRENGRWRTLTTIYDIPQAGEQAEEATCVDFPRPESPHPEIPRSYELPTTNDLEEVGQSVDDSGLADASDSTATTKLPRKRKRKPLTEAERVASWQRFSTMDLGELEEDRDIRCSAWLELTMDHGAFEPDKWAQAMIDKGEWDGFVASTELGQNRPAAWNKAS